MESVLVRREMRTGKGPREGEWERQVRDPEKVGGKTVCYEGQSLVGAPERVSCKGGRCSGVGGVLGTGDAPAEQVPGGAGG